MFLTLVLKIRVLNDRLHGSHFKRYGASTLFAFAAGAAPALDSRSVQRVHVEGAATREVTVAAGR